MKYLLVGSVLAGASLAKESNAQFHTHTSTSRHLLRASSNATATNTVNFDEDSTYDMDPMSMEKSLSMWEPKDSMFRSPKSGKGSKVTGIPTSAPTVSALDWIGYEGLEYSYYFYDILSHAIYFSPLLSFYRLLIGALIHRFRHSPKD